ncbi:T9SS type A sorting domain-containing protein [Hymenobacter sp. ASUV-10]|uniref:T9SS type A sorting domain-containing protein n=1 Tax=Hymenobacter aranciens TaxID=3063996 RepID=A0ABT9BEZ4_9BACT|nr:T9SS type A sorting domain-containing protein [Hymenobacter sp. ASUV-10]MDO7876854.1 T9SS type A sorting domain-containing protein [Hymenobacter sp. ASUV-10]
MQNSLRNSARWPLAWAVLLAVLTLGRAQGQTVTIGSTAVPVVSPATSSYLYGPFYRSATTSVFDYSRYAHLYRASELNLPAGAVITELAWLKSTAAELTGSNTFSVLMNNTALTTLPSPQTWTTLSSGATPVYTNTNQQVTGAAGSYFVVTLNQPFVYQGGNLLILTDHVKRGAATAAINFVTNPATGQALGYASNLAATAASNLTTTYGNRRPTLRITYAPGGPCVSPPLAGAAVAEPDTLCAGAGTTVFLTGASYGQGQTYQYEQSTDGVNYTDIPGATSFSYTTPALSGPRFYRARTTCGGQSATSTPVRVFVNAPTYAPLPVAESFENVWQSVCGIRDAPSPSWRTTPVVGNNAWRRFDDPAGANWTSPTFGGYTPQASQGRFSARFHSYIATAGLEGIMDLYVDMSAPGTKELTFDHINTNGTDSLFVQISTDGGATFGPRLIRLGSRATTTFRSESLPLTLTSPTTVIRFLARSDNGTTDIGLDNVNIAVTSSCLAPGGVQISATTSDSGTVTFSGAGGPYTIEYGPTGFTPGSGTTISGVTGSPYTIGTLAAYTTYDVYVTQVCASGQTGTSSVVTFTTRIGNDNCATAIPLTPGANCNPVAGSVFQASASATAACTPTTGTPDDDVWYSFVATATAHDIRLAEGVGFDGALQLYGGTCGTLMSRQCLDATAANGVEVMAATGLTVGSTYYIRVYSSGTAVPTAANGTFLICVTAPAGIPTNNECANALAVTPGAVCSPILGTTFRSTASASVPVCSPALGTPDDDVWYSFVATRTSHDVTMDEYTGFDGVLQVLSGSCGSLTSVQCADQSLAGGVETLRVGGLTVGQTYYIRIYSFANAAPTASNSNFTLCVTNSPTPPANDDCAGAIELPVQLGVTSCTTPLIGTNVGASGSAGAPAPANCTTPTSGVANYQGGDVWFKITVPLAGQLNLETGALVGSTITDTGMALYSGTCGALTQIECDDNDATGNFSLINATGLTPGAILYLRVWEVGNDVEGGFTVCATAPATCIEPAAPGADNIAATSADLTWGGAAITGESFKVEYGPTGFVPGTGTILLGLTNNLTSLTGLTPDTEYCFYVTKQCGGTQGDSPTAGPICFRTRVAVPTNDEPCGAVALTVAPAGTAPTLVNSSNVGATASLDNDIIVPACSPASNPTDVWFEFTAPGGSVDVTVTGNPAGMMRVFSGTDCTGSFTQLGCRGLGSNQAAGTLTVSGLVPGQRYFVAVSGYGSGDTPGAFAVGVASTILSSRAGLPGSALRVYPNPSSTGQLTVALQGAGTATRAQATLLNMLGQPVLTETLTLHGGTAVQTVSVKGLATGLYTLQLRVGDALISRKVILQ